MGKASARGGDETFQHLRVFEDVAALVMSNYVEEVKVDKVMEGAMRGLADGLDPDSAYLNAKQVADVEAGSAMPGRGRRPRADAPVLPAGDRGARRLPRRQGRPADRRLRARDRRQADARPVGVRRHAPAARPARLEGHADGHPRQRGRSARGGAGARKGGRAVGDRASSASPAATLRPRRLEHGGSAAALARGRLRPHRRFRAGVVEDLRKQIADVSKSGAKSLIIDVRRTAEGPIENGIAAARLFVKSGTLAIKAGRKGEAKRNRRGARRRRRDHAPGPDARHERHVRGRRGLRRGAQRQQARGARRRAHDRTRRACRSW